MASDEVTGATVQELAELRFEHRQSRNFTRYGIPFEAAFCLTPIGKQPDEYDGPQRYCKQRAARLTEDEWNEKYDDEYPERRSAASFDERAYHPSCRFHGRSCGSGQNADNLERPGFANLRHGMYAEDWRLKEDFSEADAKMFDYIMSWADIYGWPPQEEDPARYDLLEQFAYDRVRTLRAEEWFEDIAAQGDGQSEIEYREVHDEQGMVVGEVPVPNTLSEDLRLLRKEILDLMKEMGLTPKSRGEMDAMESEASANDAIAEITREALGGDHEYDPSDFEGESEPDDAAEQDNGD